MPTLDARIRASGHEVVSLELYTYDGARVSMRHLKLDVVGR